MKKKKSASIFSIILLKTNTVILYIELLDFKHLKWLHVFYYELAFLKSWDTFFFSLQAAYIPKMAIKKDKFWIHSLTKCTFVVGNA